MPGKPKNKRPGKLISILTRVLAFVRSGEYRDCGEFMVFGAPAAFSDEVTRQIDKASRTLGQYRSRVRVNRRTTLNQEPDLEGHLRRADLADTGRQYVEAVLGGRAPKEVKLPKRGREDPAAISDIEMHFADELLKKLPKIVERAASLDEIVDEEMDKGHVPGDAKRYWEEAHRCYLFGFHVACAVLCRAILESALKARVDPKGLMEQSLPKGRSYFKALVENAELLQDSHDSRDDRPCALDVKDAGDWAIHDMKRFNETYGIERLHEVLANTRKVLLDLYTGGGAE